MRQLTNKERPKEAKAVKLAETHKARGSSKVKEVRTATNDSTKHLFPSAKGQAKKKRTSHHSNNASAIFSTAA